MGQLGLCERSNSFEINKKKVYIKIWKSYEKLKHVEMFVRNYTGLKVIATVRNALAKC